MNATASHPRDLLLAKTTSMCVLGAASLLLGLLPLPLSRLAPLRPRHLALSLLLCAGGGVLLFTTFVHLAPEVRAAFAHLALRRRLPARLAALPTAELAILAGFFLVYLVEEVAHLLLRAPPAAAQPPLAIPRASLARPADDDSACISSSRKDLLDAERPAAGGGCGESLSGLLAVLALSFHAVFEGLAVGLEDDVDRVWYLFGAIATHKFVIAFCVGIELVAAKTRMVLVFVYLGTFAAVTPLGIGIGLLLTDGKNSEDDVTSAVLQGMAAGTLIYVVFFEVLARERGNKHGGIWQFLAILAGFGVMCALQVLTGHDHDHHHAEDGHQHHNHDL